jgi:hypothetical protein
MIQAQTYLRILGLAVDLALNIPTQLHCLLVLASVLHGLLAEDSL